MITFSAKQKPKCLQKSSCFNELSKGAEPGGTKFLSDREVMEGTENRTGWKSPQESWVPSSTSLQLCRTDENNAPSQFTQSKVYICNRSQNIETIIYTVRPVRPQKASSTHHEMEGFSWIAPSGSTSMWTKSTFLRARAPGASGHSMYTSSLPPQDSHCVLYARQLLKRGSDAGEGQVQSCHGGAGKGLLMKKGGEGCWSWWDLINWDG